MKFQIKMNCDNSAFSGEYLSHEIANILRNIATKIDRGVLDGISVDFNGNYVAKFEYKKGKFKI